MNHPRLIAIAFSSLLAMASPLLQAQEPSPFSDLGKVAPTSESRGSMLVENSKGEPLFLVIVRDVIEGKGPRTSLLITNLNSGQTEQVFFPEERVSNANNYCLFVSSKGHFYLSTDRYFFEYDLNSRKVLSSHDKMNGPAMSMDEDAEGNIYFAIYPTSELFRYTPEKKELTKVARLDPIQQYPTTLAIDEDGWIYTGIGTAKPLLIAYNPKTGERLNLTDEKAKGPGAGSAFRLKNGAVYGKTLADGKLTRLKGGRFLPEDQRATIPPEERQASLYWLQKRHELPSGIAITDLSLRERTLRWKNAEGEEKTIPFAYETDGADISCMTIASNGKIYGNTSHPMELWEYDPEANKVSQLGHDPRIGGGNITKLLPWKKGVVGNSYSKGDLYFFDPAIAFHAEAGQGENPALLTNSAPWVNRPRAMLLHPDGAHLLSAGFPGYGRLGSGLLIYNMETREQTALLTPDLLLPDQGISSMASSPDGELIYLAGTINAPGGATATAESSELAAFSWKDRKLVWKFAPIEHAKQITSVQLLDAEHLAGITSDGIFFIVHLPEQKTIHQQKLDHSPAGSRGDTSFVRLADGKTSLLLMQTAIFKLDHATRQLSQIAQPPTPIANVGPVVQGNLYFSSAGSLWKFELPKALH